MNPSSVERLRFFGVVALCGLLFFPSLGGIPFFNKGEPREALVVQEIVHHGSWLFPLKGGEQIPSKPPLFHWFAAVASLASGGVTEASVRFPSALFAALGALVLYGLGRRMFGAETAFWAAAILATSVGYQSEAISARVDMTLGFFMTLTLAVFFLFYRGDLRGVVWRIVLYLLLGITVLAKGPVGLVLPGMIICGFLVLKRDREFFRRLVLHPGALLTLAIPLLWYGLALIRGGEDFFLRQIFHENLARFFVHGEGGTGHQKPVYYYVPYLILDGLPWSLFLPVVIYDGWRRRMFLEERALFLSLWVGIIFVFFSLSAGKRSAYLLPLYPPLSLLTALWLVRAVEDRGRSLAWAALGCVFLIGALALLPLAWATIEPAHLRWAFAAIEAALKPKDQAHVAMVQQALGRAGWGLFFLLLLSGSLWGLVGAQLLAARLRGAAATLVGLSVITALLAQHALLPWVAQAKTYKPFVMEVNRIVAKEGSLCLYGRRWDPTSVIFYRGGGAPPVDDGPESLRRHLGSSDSYCVMGEDDWNGLGPAERLSYSVILTSQGLGPDGDARLVLIRSGV